MKESWQPISTAPRDGTRILGWWKNGGIETVRYKCGRWCDDYGDNVDKPNKWQPLLPPLETKR